MKIKDFSKDYPKKEKIKNRKVFKDYEIKKLLHDKRRDWECD